MENIKHKLSKKRGFTLVELLVVIAIIAILSVTAFISLGGETGKARDAKRQQDLSTIQNALEIIMVREGSYPSVVDFDAGNIDKKYLSQMPTDPKTGNGYTYAVSGSTYLLAATLEKDGVPGNYEAYVTGNGEYTLLAGEGVDGSACGSSPSSCNIDPDADPNCIPYCP